MTKEIKNTVEVISANGERFNYDDAQVYYSGSIVSVSVKDKTVALFGNPNSVEIEEITE